jgi:hypothetical protein
MLALFRPSVNQEAGVVVENCQSNDDFACVYPQEALLFRIYHWEYGLNLYS